MNVSEYNYLRKCLFVTVLLFMSSHMTVIAIESKKITKDEYQAKFQSQAECHQLIRAGDGAKRNGNYSLAVQYYEQGLNARGCAGLRGVIHGELSRTYEQMELYVKALAHVEWILGHNPSSQKYLETRDRLLKKIDEQKKWKSEQDSVVPQIKEAFDVAGHEEQKQFLESLGGQGVLDVFKDAMVAEHGGDYKKARGIYESLLPRKEEIDTQMGPGGWVMLYPAIQRTSELLEDQKREKEALVWMKENLLPENAPYHNSLSKLLPQNVAHLEKRIKDYQL